MGITIHYHGGLDDPAQLDAALTMLRAECQRRSWPYDEHDFEASGTFETYTFRTVPTDLPGVSDSIADTEYVELDTRWRGLIIDPHPDCEALFMMFDPQTGRLMMLMDIADGHSLSYQLGTKTQFAPVDTHIAICEVLHRLQADFGAANLHVNDEGEYFDTGNVKTLMQKRGIIEQAMNNLELITGLTRWATAGDPLEPPDAEQLSNRLN
jgi:hypothetical protein